MTQSDMPSEPQTTPLGALKNGQEKHLSEMPAEPDAEDVLEFEQGTTLLGRRKSFSDRY